MQYEVRGTTKNNTRISDTLPRRGQVNEVCKEWVVHEDGALAYRLQKQEVEQHYVNNKERNARVREDFPKAKEEQEKEILEAAEKYRLMIKQQEKLDTTYAHRVAEKFEYEEHARRKRAEMRDQEIAQKLQSTFEITNKNSMAAVNRLNNPASTLNMISDINRVGLPMVESDGDPEPVHHETSITITHSLRNLRLKKEGNSGSCLGTQVKNITADPSYSNIVCGDGSSSSNYASTAGIYARVNNNNNCNPVSAVLVPEDLNEIITDADLQAEADRRLQEEKDAEFARLLQQQEEEIINGAVDKDRLLAIEAQDKELAKLLHEKEKAKVRRAKERARQKALLKKQQQQQVQNLNEIVVVTSGTIPSSSSSNDLSYGLKVDKMCSGSITEIDEDRINGNSDEIIGSISNSSSSSMMRNVAMHIDPTYLSHQSASMPNSLIFQDGGENNIPPYMPIQGQRRNPPSAEKKQKKVRSKDGCKQQ